jgi:hypothetical protein
MIPTTQVIPTLATFVAPASHANQSFLGKSARFVLGLAALICALGFASSCETSEAASPLVAHVQNNHLVDGNGNVLRLLGVDRSGSEYMCVAGAGVFDGPVDAAAIAAIAAWRVNAVRVPLNEDCWLGINLPESNPYIGAAYQNAIVAFVQALNNAGMYVILDLHWNAPGTYVANQQQPMADLDHSPAFWSSVATTFKDFPGVIFDLYNEPYVSSWACWQSGCSVTTSDGTWMTAGMTQLVDVVRATGATQPIMLGGLSYASDLSQWSAYAPADPIAGPAQLVASYHSYCGPPGTSTVAQCQSAMSSIEGTQWPVVSTLAKSVPVVTGEFGEYDCATTCVTPYMAFADANGISYLGWAWNPYNCGSFPALISDYTGTATAYGIGLKSHLDALSERHDTHDFNGDGYSDIAWRDASGIIAVWLMNGAAVVSADSLGLVPTAWSLVGQRDFNGDGYADLLWRDAAGDIAIWFLKPSQSIWFVSPIQVLSTAGVGNVSLTWSVAGTGDFNGDGMGDLLWRDTSGDTAIWLMNGATVTSAAGLGNTPTTWSVVGTGDFNGDGKADLLWRDTSGDTAIWFMNGTTVASSAGLGNTPIVWSVVGTGDFNGDGYSDILWQDSSGNVAVWLMNGATVLSSAGLGNVPTAWSLLTGDYDGDGKSDLLWCDTSGNTSIWFMDGTTVSSTASVGNVPTTWTVQNANAE